MIALKGISRIESKLEKFKNRVRADGGTLLNYDTIQSLYSGLPALVRSDAPMVMLPCGYKSGKLYGLNGNDFIFSRGSNATRVNENGLIELVSSNIPRLQFDAATNLYQGLLMEKASTNLFIQSDPTTAQGTNSNVTFGSNTWSKGFSGKVSYGDNSLQRSYFNATVAGSTQYTFSCFVKMGDSSVPSIGATNATGDFSILIGGAIVSGTVIVDWGGGVYRIYGTATTIGTPASTTQNGIIKYTGQSSKTFDVTGFQLEQSSIVTSYIPTTTATTTRAGDTCYNADVSAAYNSNEDTLWAHVSKLTLGSDDTIFSIGFGSGESYFLRKRGSNDYLFGLRPSGSNFDTVNSVVYSSGSSKIAGAVKINDAVIVVNGNVTNVATFNKVLSANNPAITIGALPIANATGGCFIVKAIALFSTRRTNAELQTLTT